MAGTFGYVIRHKMLTKIGVRNELIGMAIATLVGFCCGSTICTFTDKYGTQTWPTYEMMSRGELRSLWVGCLIALLSGAVVALGILSDNIASLVGVAISTSITPPAVNAGLFWSMATVYYLKGDRMDLQNLTLYNYYSNDPIIELLALGAINVCLTVTNIICIYAASILVFKLKEVAPMSSRDPHRRTFWRYDIKIARDYNRTLQHGDGQGMIENLSHDIAEFQKYGISTTDEAAPKPTPTVPKKGGTGFTWSPNMSCTEEFRKLRGLYETLVRGPAGVGSCVSSTTSNVRSDGSRRRLSQIFVRDGDAAADFKVSNSSEESDSRHLVCGKRKFTVTPCKIDSFLP